MTLSNRNLAALLNTLVKSAVDEAVAKTRIPKLLTGSVEDVSDELDTVFIRMDQEAMSADPTQSLNYEAPGVIPATRLGQTFTGDQARVTFDGPAGASAMQTGVQKKIVLPFGSESGARVVLDGDSGTIAFYDGAGNLVGLLTSENWQIGDVENAGERITLDPIGGLRIRDNTDTGVAILDKNGYSLRDPVSGLTTAELQGGHFQLSAASGENIEMVTESGGSLRAPLYKTLVEQAPGSSLVVPATTTSVTPTVDLSIGHVATWIRVTPQTTTWTPPTGWTERVDESTTSAGGTLSATLATTAGTAAAATFTSSATNWQFGIGTHVIVSGDPTHTPTFRSVSTVVTVTTASVITGTINKPDTLSVGDTMLAFVSLGNSGGFVPTGWTTPQGFMFLGANFASTGDGATLSTLATGVWAKIAGTADLTATNYSTTINIPTGNTKILHTAMMAVSNPSTIPGGTQIRVAGHPIRRLLASVELTASTQTLCDFQNISGGYDHLELIYDCTSAVSTDSQARLIKIRFNNDSTNNYHWRRGTNGTDTTFAFSSALTVSHAYIGAIEGAGTTGSKSNGKVTIHDYTRLNQRALIADGVWVQPSVSTIRYETFRGYYRDTTTPINRVTVSVETGTAKFSSGDRAFLYGY